LRPTLWAGRLDIINMFWSLAQARMVISDWKEDYNHRRRHSALGYQAVV
jgi:transposase InsO family protein